MIVKINSDSIRIDGPTLRFLVEFPELSPGYHGIAVPLPTSRTKIREAMLTAGTTLQDNLSQIASWKTNFADLLDTPLEI